MEQEPADDACFHPGDLIPVDFADISRIARACFAGPRETPFRGTESWSANLHGIAVTLYFEHAFDRWTIFAESDVSWEIRFTFETDVPYSLAHVQFGRFGQVRDATVKNPTACRRQITVLRVLMPGGDFTHGTAPFTVV